MSELRRHEPFDIVPVDDYQGLSFTGQGGTVNSAVIRIQVVPSFMLHATVSACCSIM
jgi:hypothetical protein